MSYTSGPSHLGDCLWAAHVIRRIPGPHVFHCPTAYHWQLQECFEGCDVTLRDVANAPDDALNTWIACGRFTSQGVFYENNVDMVEYLMRWDNQMLGEADWDREFTPLPRFHTHQDLLFDFPAIRRNVVAPEFDILVVNSPPGSGQCPEWDQGEMNGLILELCLKYRVVSTNPTGLSNGWIISASVCNIGNLSLRAKCVVAVASGGHWCVHNPWRTCPLYLLLEPQRLDFGQPVTHAKNVTQMRELLRTGGWL